MDKSKLLYNSIAVLILLIVLSIYLILTFKTPVADSSLSFGSMKVEPITLLKVRLFWMIPILFITVILSIVFAFIIEEWLSPTNIIRQIIEPYIVILSGIPSMIYGLLAVYHVVFNLISSSYTSLTLILILLVIPTTTLSTQTAIRNVDTSIRNAAYAVGGTKWQVIFDHVLPLSALDILSGVCYTISRVLTVTAVCILVLNLLTSDFSTLTVINIVNNVGIILLLVLIFSIIASLIKKNTG
ncbi:ABC transporter permease subunit [Candidatus Poribacteria bacterium]|nr:ABC transporter permease subunit [Candidatus Poribacteria bacterium]